MADDLQFICKRTVVSTKEVKPGKFYPLSVLDHSMELNRIHIIIYYNYPEKLISNGEQTKKLRESLAELLTSFPMVTGRLKRSPEGKWMIKCNDAGVRMVEATAKGSVEEWLERVDRERELQLAYWEDMFHNPYFWSTFYVQVRGCGNSLHKIKRLANFHLLGLIGKKNLASIIRPCVRRMKGHEMNESDS